MKGLELCRGYYEEYGKPMLEQEFSDLLPYLAIGCVGSGSDRYGFDDSVSQDHDYEPGFCIFLPDESVVDRRRAFLLERAYAKLPKVYQGVKRQSISPVGGSRNGVMRTDEFYRNAVGAADGGLTMEAWLRIPDYALAEATNGELWLDAYGQFSAIRQGLMQMPPDIRAKRLAGNLLLMAQAGQYNFRRCLSHGETEAAQLACTEFVTAAMKAAFLLRGKYMPYYKWSFRALRQLEDTENLAANLSYLLHANTADPDAAEEKQYVIEDIASELIALLQAQNLTDAICGDLEKHAYSVNDHILDSEIRNLHILTAI